jgi:broad specificity phosphatase PhoE
MPKLILIKHSVPQTNPHVPPNQWPLSDLGRRRAEKLAEKLRLHRPDLIVSSLEPKAMETGQIIAAILGAPFETAQDLHEHDRSSNSAYTTQAHFEGQVAQLFENPDRLIFGRETANEAYLRYKTALLNLIDNFSGETLAVVSHGTVMALFVAHANKFDPFPFWKQLGLPSYLVLARPEFGLLTDIENVEES